MRKRRVLMSAFVLWIALGAAGSVDKKASAQTIRRTARVASPPRSAASQLYSRARSFEPYILQAARRYAVDPRALWAIAFLETGFRPELISPKGARGMMQFMPGTAARFGLSNPHDPLAAIEAAARYARFLSNRYSYNPALVLAAYNAGEGAVDAYLHGITIRLKGGKVINPTGRKTGGVPPYVETISYVSRGLSVMRQVNEIGIFSQDDLASCRVPTIVPPAINNYPQPDFNNREPALARAGFVEASTTSPANIPGASADAREAAFVPTSIFAREPTNPEATARIVAESGVGEEAKGGVPSSTNVGRLAVAATAVQSAAGEIRAARSGAIEPLQTGASTSRVTATTSISAETPRVPTSSRARRD